MFVLRLIDMKLNALAEKEVCFADYVKARDYLERTGTCSKSVIGEDRPALLKRLAVLVVEDMLPSFVKLKYVSLHIGIQKITNGTFYHSDNGSREWISLEEKV